MRLALGSLVVGVMGCATAVEPEPTPISWEEFQSLALQDPVSGVYVYDGDQVAEDLVDLGRGYDEYRAQFDLGESVATSELIVNKLRRGGIDKWANPMSITYCVDTVSFGPRHAEVSALVEGALADWQATGAGVLYTHVTAEDASCTNANTNVTFNVRQDSSNQYYARAFFPSYSRGSREVVISTISYDPSNLGPWTLRGILRHELGHTFGFRHEHIRPENKLRNRGTCSAEDKNWLALTPYDSASVMHYPHNGCAGTNQGDLEITAVDAQGALALYPL